MMRTQTDLRTAVRDRADRAPAPSADLLAGRLPGGASSRRTAAAPAARRVPAIAAAVLVTAGVATGAVVAASSIGGGAPPHAAGTHPPTAARHTRHSTAPMPPPPSLIGSTVGVAYDGPGAIQVDESTEAQYVLLRGGHLLRDVTLYGRGLFAPSSIAQRRAVTVNGSPGFVGTAYPWFGDDLSHTDPAHPPTTSIKWAHRLPILAWKIAPGQWVSVASDRPGEATLAGLRAIARHVHAVSRPVRTPIKVGYLPPGQKVSNVDYDKPYDGYGSSSLLGFRRNDRFGYWSWDISVARGSGSSGDPGVHSVDPEVSRTIGDYTVTVQTLGAISKAEAMKVLASVTLAASPGHPNRSWFDLAHALP